MVDFTVGKGEYHKGFKQAADYVYDGFISYRNSIEQRHPRQEGVKYNDDKIWVAGHSLGAAVTNILGGDLLKNAGFTKDTIYALCFACPNVMNGNKAANQVHVYNITGDLVANVPPTGWKHNGRYGTVHTYTSDHVGFASTNNLPYYTINTSADIQSSVRFIRDNLEDYADLFTEYLPDYLAKDEANLINIYKSLIKIYLNEDPVSVVKDLASIILAKEILYGLKDGSSFVEKILETHGVSTYAVWMKMEYSNYGYGDYSL